MHFHFMPYKRYKKAYSLLSKINVALDLQIAKDIVLENTPSNVGVISNSTQFNLSALSSILKSIDVNLIQDKLEHINLNNIITQLNISRLFSPIIGTLSDIGSLASISGLYPPIVALSDLVSNSKQTLNSTKDDGADILKSTD